MNPSPLHEDSRVIPRPEKPATRKPSTPAPRGSEDSPAPAARRPPPGAGEMPPAGSRRAGGDPDAEALGAPGKRRPPVHRRFDWPRCFYALLTATLLWSYVSYKRTIEMTMDIVVRVVLPEDWRDAAAAGGGEAVRRMARVTFRGSNRAMAELGADRLVIEPELRFDAVTADSYEQALVFESRMIRDLPQGISVVRFDPPRMAIAATRLVTYPLPVKLEVEGRPNEKYVYTQGGYQIFPSEVEIRIPKALQERIAPTDNILTQPFNLAEPGSRLVKLQPFVKEGHEAWPTPSTVYVTVNLDVKPATRKVEGVPLQRLMPQSLLSSPAFARLRFEPAQVAVTLEGMPDVINYLDPKSVDAYVEMGGAADLGGGIFGFWCKAIAPPGCKVVLIEPDQVRGVP